MLKLLRRLLFLGVLSAAGYALWKRFAANVGDEPTGLGWEAQPSPFPPAPVVRSTPAPASSAAWVEADDGACPTTHPVKAKLTSGIFHVPGGTNYERTRADRCYVDPPAAEADGLRQAKR
jgi:hypothetical protein